MYEDAKLYLNKYLSLKKEVNRIKRTIDLLREDIGVSAINYDGLPRSTITSSPTETTAIIIADEVIELNRRKTEAVEAMLEIEKIIESIESPDVADVLFLRYIEGRSWKYIEMASFYSESTAMRLHREGLKAVEEMRSAI